MFRLVFVGNYLPDLVKVQSDQAEREKGGKRQEYVHEELRKSECSEWGGDFEVSRACPV